MIDKSQNEALLLLSKEFEEEEHYRAYALFREKGLRKQAFGSLEQFIKEFEKKTQADQMEFIIKLFSLADTENADIVYVGLAEPLRRVLFPKMKMWCDAGYSDARFYYWYGVYAYDIEYVRKALEVDPDFERAKIKLICFDLDKLDFATHHLPDYYIEDGNEEEDFKLCKKVEDKIMALSEERAREHYLKELAVYQELIANYIDWKKSGSSNLEEWGKQNHKRVSSFVKTYYYKK